MSVFAFFERLVAAYPNDAVKPWPDKLLPFLWACTRGLRPHLLLMTLLAASIGAFEALLFAFLGRIVDWLAAVKPAELWQVHGDTLMWLGIALAASMVITLGWALLRFNTMAGNFPMRLRWQFHRLLLGQSMSFYQDEFAGRISTKLMQTALAVRDVWMIGADILIYVVVYFATLIGVLAGFDAWLLAPFLCWLGLYLISLRYFVPRLAKVSQAQADARSLMTGRITDAYTNIATVKLFSHAHREAAYARNAMGDFMETAYGQMRLVTMVDQINQLLSVLLLASTTALSLWLWSQGQVGVGAVAAAGAMALRLNGISHWIMWELSSLFEHVGTVADGMGIMSKHHSGGGSSPTPRPLEVVPHGEVRFEARGFSLRLRASRRTSAMIDELTLRIKPGEKIGLVGRSGAGKSTVVNLLLRFYDIQQGRILIDGQDIAGVSRRTACAPRIGMVTQDTSLLHRSVRENIMYGKPDATEDADAAHRRPKRRQSDFVDLALMDPEGAKGVRRTRGRARRQALGRSAPTRRDRARDAEGRADPACSTKPPAPSTARSRRAIQAEPVQADGRQDRRRHCAPACPPSPRWTA